MEDIVFSADINNQDQIRSRLTNITIRDLEFVINPILNINWNFQSNRQEENGWSFYEIKIQQLQNDKDIPFPLYSKESLYFDGYRFKDFFFQFPSADIRKDHINIILPFYIAKITKVELSGNKLFYEILNNSDKDLALKLLLHSYSEYQYSFEDQIIILKEKSFGEIELDESYNYARIIMSIKDSTFYIQEVHIGQSPIKLKEIPIPQTLDELFECTKNGENQYLEFKEKLNKNDILKEMIAFVNTNEGIICLGVKDNGIDYVGVEKTPQKIRDELIDFVSKNCVPYSLPFNVKDLKFKEYSYIYLIVIAEGDDKPYYHRLFHHVYIRAHGTSRPALRDELLELISEKVR